MSKQLKIIDAVDVISHSKESFLPFFKRKNSFVELGVLNRPKKEAEKTEWARFKRIEREEIAFVLSNFYFDEEGALWATVNAYTPIKFKGAAEELEKAEPKIKFHPRFIRRRISNGNGGSIAISEIITMDATIG